MIFLLFRFIWLYATFQCHLMLRWFRKCKSNTLHCFFFFFLYLRLYNCIYYSLRIISPFFLFGRCFAICWLEFRWSFRFFSLLIFLVFLIDLSELLLHKLLKGFLSGLGLFFGVRYIGGWWFIIFTFLKIFWLILLILISLISHFELNFDWLIGYLNVLFRQKLRSICWLLLRGAGFIFFLSDIWNNLLFQFFEI
jgi:hypothetical protein